MTGTEALDLEPPVADPVPLAIGPVSIEARERPAHSKAIVPVVVEASPHHTTPHQ